MAGRENGKYNKTKASTGKKLGSRPDGAGPGRDAVGDQDEEVVAQGLAQTQLEYTKSYPYDPEATTYPTVDTPEGYVISIDVASIPDTDADIQKITVTISRDSEDLITVEDYKVNR
jgi:hypothetical protein